MKYQHYCTDCNPMFRDMGLDVYWCPSPSGGSIILRFGDDAPDYHSMPVDVYLTLHREGDATRNCLYRSAVVELFRDGRLSVISHHERERAR